MNTAILAIVTVRRELVLEGGSTPVFYAPDRAEQDRISILLSKILLGMVHDLENGVCLIVSH
mgnify:FL=1